MNNIDLSYLVVSGLVLPENNQNAKLPDGGHGGTLTSATRTRMNSVHNECGLNKSLRICDNFS
jgi:hypothetical protein